MLAYAYFHFWTMISTKKLGDTWLITWILAKKLRCEVMSSGCWSHSPYSTVGLLSLKALFWLIPGENLSGGAFAATVIFIFGLYIGVMAIADSITGQKPLGMYEVVWAYKGSIGMSDWVVFLQWRVEFSGSTSVLLVFCSHGRAPCKPFKRSSSSVQEVRWEGWTILSQAFS